MISRRVKTADYRTCRTVKEANRGSSAFEVLSACPKAMYNVISEPRQLRIGFGGVLYNICHKARSANYSGPVLRVCYRNKESYLIGSDSGFYTQDAGTGH